MTLSACDAADGKLEGEEGFDGLAEAFLLAGAKSVVGALWEVEDSATRSLMKYFYLHLAQGQDKPPRSSKRSSIIFERRPIAHRVFGTVHLSRSPLCPDHFLT